MKRTSIQKILQALYYIQSHAPLDNIFRSSKVYFLKILFFADRYHIRKFGILGSGDVYFAMKNGPVASVTFDLLKGKAPKGIKEWEINLLDEIEDIDENNVYIKHQDDDELSESFKMALDFALDTYGKYKYYELSKISHDYPEWKKFEKKLNEKVRRIEMSTDDFFENPESLTESEKHRIFIDPFADDDKEFLALQRDGID